MMETARLATTLGAFDNKPSNRLLTKAASSVLTSLRSSPYGLGKRLFIQAMGGPGEHSLRFAPSLAAALLDSLSEQPAGDLDSVSHREDRLV